MLVKFNIPTPEGNQAMKGGAIPGKLKQIIDDLKPEAAYFSEENGERTGYLFLDMADPSDLPRIAEPLYLAFNARFTARPAMTLDDLAKAAPYIERAIKTYG